MSAKALTLWSALAAALGLVAIALTLQPAAPRTAAPLLAFAPSDVAALTVEPAGGLQTELVRDGAGWRLRAGPDAEGWPVGASNVRQALRVLAELTDTAPAQQSPEGDRAVSVTVRTSGGGLHTIRFGAATVAGSCAASVGDSAWAVPTQARDIFLRPGPPGWRDPAVLPGVGVNVSRISAERADGAAVFLRRVGGRWSVSAGQEGAAHRASEGAVRGAIEALSGLSVIEFIDDPSAQGAHNDETLAMRLRVERDERRVDAGRVAVTTKTIGLDVFGAVSLSGADRAGVSASGQRFVFDASELAAFRVDAEAYVARTACAAAPADIGVLVLGARGEIGVRRTPAGWERMDGAAALPSEIEEAVGFLTERLASAAQLVAPGGLADASRVSLYDLDGGELETVTIGRTPTGAFAVEYPPIVGTGDVVRLVYNETPPPALLALAIGS